MKEIPALNLFMMCEKLNREALAEIPAGFSIRTCRKDELEVWKSLQVDDPKQYDACMAVLTDYFERVYAKNQDLFFSRCLFACNEQDQPIGTCFVWKAYGKINTIHWFKVAKSYEGLGIGRALLSYVMKDLRDEDFPVFLHTHPSCFRAMKLYSDFGFVLLDGSQVGSRKNNLKEALPILEEVMPREAYGKLSVREAPDDFLNAALTSDKEEF